MKQYYFSFIALLVLSLALSGCYKDKDWDWVSQNTTASGKYAPVSSNVLYDLNLTNPNNTTNPRVPRSVNSKTVRESLAAGYTLQTELQYYCIDPIKEIVVYEVIGTNARTLLRTIPYQPSFSRTKGVDTLLISYTIPTLATGTTLHLEMDVISSKGLSIVASTANPTALVPEIANNPTPRRIFMRVR